jgi:hypothetical protein
MTIYPRAVVRHISDGLDGKLTNGSFRPTTDPSEAPMSTGELLKMSTGRHIHNFLGTPFQPPAFASRGCSRCQFVPAPPKLTIPCDPAPCCPVLTSLIPDPACDVMSRWRSFLWACPHDPAVWGMFMKCCFFCNGYATCSGPGRDGVICDPSIKGFPTSSFLCQGILTSRIFACHYQNVFCQLC